jgi:hypothetical protein
MTTDFFTYHKPKVIQALRYHFISRKEIKVMMVLVNVFSLISAGLFYYKKISPAAFLLSSLMWFLMMLTFWFLLPRMVYRKSATFKDRFKIDVNEMFFQLENDRASKTWQWNEFSIWLESPHFFHLYFNPTSFFLIPKEIFDNENEHRVRKLLKEKLSK